MPKKKNIKTLQITHASMKHSDSAKEFREDLRTLDGYGGDIIGFTEVGDRNSLLNDFARANGLAAITYPHGDGGYLIRTGPNLKVKRKNAVKAHPGEPGKYGARYVHEVAVIFHGREIWMHEAHWVNKAEVNKSRGEDHAKMTRTIASEVRKHAQGDKISFFGGDLNFDPNERGYPRHLFRENKLMVCWDDAGVQPPTGPGGGTIDLIGRYGPDKDVSFKRYKVHNRGNSDHRPFSVWYEIDVERGADVGGNGGGSNGGNGGNGGGNGGNTPNPNPTKDDDFYATGGNVDWSDYQDDAVYDLPYAVDDSDTENG